MILDLLSNIGVFFTAFTTPGGLFMGVATVAAAAVTPYIANFLHLNATDSRRAYIQDAVKNALAYGVSVVSKNPNATDLVAVKDDVIAIAKVYLNTLVPEGLAALKVDNDAALTQLLEAGFTNGLDELSSLLGNLIPRQAAAKVALLQKATLLSNKQTVVVVP